MMLYAVVWSTNGREWNCSKMTDNPEIAHARLTLDQLENPGWKHRIIEGEVPNETVQP